MLKSVRGEKGVLVQSVWGATNHHVKTKSMVFRPLICLDSY